MPGRNRDSTTGHGTRTDISSISSCPLMVLVCVCECVLSRFLAHPTWLWLLSPQPKTAPLLHRKRVWQEAAADITCMGQRLVVCTPSASLLLLVVVRHDRFPSLSSPSLLMKGCNNDAPPVESARICFGKNSSQCDPCPRHPYLPLPQEKAAPLRVVAIE